MELSQIESHLDNKYAGFKHQHKWYCKRKIHELEDIVIETYYTTWSKQTKRTKINWI